MEAEAVEIGGQVRRRGFMAMSGKTLTAMSSDLLSDPDLPPDRAVGRRVLLGDAGAVGLRQAFAGLAGLAELSWAAASHVERSGVAELRERVGRFAWRVG